MSHPSDQHAPLSRRSVWVDMLLYPRHTLPTAAAPVLVATGLAWADGVAAPGAAVAAFLAGWLIQLGGVIADNYHNLLRHPDDQEHPALVRALRAGVLSLAELRRTFLACYGVAAVVGALLVYVGGVPALVIGLTSVAASFVYSGGPKPLGDHALGDPLFFVFFGIVAVVGSYYVQAAATLAAPFPLGVPAGTVTATSIIASLPIAALTTNILVIDNIRDLDYDRAKRERTVAVVIGRRWSLVEYDLLLVVAYAVPLWLWYRGAFGPAVLLPLVSAPYAANVARQVARARSHEALIPMSPRAGQVLLAYSVLFAVGLSRIVG